MMAIMTPTSLPLLVLPVHGLPEVGAGDDLAALLVAALGPGGLAEGDVVVVASKVVAKSEGRVVPEWQREEAIAGQTAEVVASRQAPDGRVVAVVRAYDGHVTANAGVDVSDVPQGSALLLPTDPDASARRLRARLRELLGVGVGVVVTDTTGRPWRDGVVDVAVGVAGVQPLDDLRGTEDRFGRSLDVTVRAVADEVAAAADLVRGKATGCPVAVVRGLTVAVGDEDGPGAATLRGTERDDWFRWGHVEAVRSALGVGARVPPPPVRADRQPPGRRLRRAVDAWSAEPEDRWAWAAGARAEIRGATVVLTGDAVAVGAGAARLAGLLRADRLLADVGPPRSRGPEVTLLLTVVDDEAHG